LWCHHHHASWLFITETLHVWSLINIIIKYGIIWWWWWSSSSLSSLSRTKLWSLQVHLSKARTNSKITVNAMFFFKVFSCLDAFPSWAQFNQNSFLIDSFLLIQLNKPLGFGNWSFYVKGQPSNRRKNKNDIFKMWMLLNTLSGNFKLTE